MQQAPALILKELHQAVDLWQSESSLLTPSVPMAPPGAEPAATLAALLSVMILPPAGLCGQAQSRAGVSK
jgi:hypothetical protein